MTVETRPIDQLETLRGGAPREQNLPAGSCIDQGRPVSV
jgi:hypothetical protein